jgi:sensor histidine kinase YesM
VTKKQKIYWICQTGGWLFFWALNLFFYGLTNKITIRDFFIYSVFILTGIVLTHANRFFILKFHIFKTKIVPQLVYILVSSFILAIIFLTVGSLQRATEVSVENILNAIVPYIFWSAIYFGFHFFENYKKTEIQNLRWEASSKDIELNKLKSQLNPHFMFNSMNSIRALIDEDPSKAKEAVTQLSNILRNTLLMNKNKEIFLEEELKIVKDYLALEHIRYEERLNYNFDIENEALKINVPPLIVQAQVENAIKHGISKLPKGGNVNISAKTEGKDLLIDINNTGQLSHEKSETGFGLQNSQHRLELLYGNKASIRISNTNTNEVSVKIKIPFN